MRATLSWVRAQPDRPFVILFSHIVVVLLYLTHRAVSDVPFTSHQAHSVVTSPAAPCLHALAAVGLIIAMADRRRQGCAAVVSLFTWTATTIALYFAATQRKPPLALWSPALGLVITLAAFLMVVRWGVDGDEREVS